MPIRGLTSKNSVPALEITGHAGQVVLLDSELEQKNNGSGPAFPAIEHVHGVLFAFEEYRGQ